MYSLQRRRERYRIIYTWKIIEGLVPNFGLNASINERLGRFVEIEKLNKNASCRIKTLKEKSFKINGPRLFNCLPMEIRNLTKCSVDDFKEKLDKFLGNVQDEPKTQNLTPAGCDQFSGKPSNSLIDQVRRLNLKQGG